MSFNRHLFLLSAAEGLLYLYASGLIFIYLWIAVVKWLVYGTPTWMIQVRFPSDWLLHHGNSRGRHSANHNLLPDMHLRVPVLREKTCCDSRLV